MEIIVNELSLDGQFQTIEEFFEAFRKVLMVQHLMDMCSATLLKHYDLYNQPVTSSQTLHAIMISNDTKTRSEIRAFRTLLRKLMQNPPFWQDDQRHSSSDVYNCAYTSATHSYSLAEACERHRIVLSFEHSTFNIPSLVVSKNGTQIELVNIYQPIMFMDSLLEQGLISQKNYCLHRYQGTNLSFEHLEDRYGFNTLENGEAHEFLSTFQMFCTMSWTDIHNHDGLDYKRYDRSQKDWFASSPFASEDIYKFRASRRYRCFGYRDNDVFYVLRFETDHKISDKG